MLHYIATFTTSWHNKATPLKRGKSAIGYQRATFRHLFNPPEKHIAPRAWAQRRHTCAWACSAVLPTVWFGSCASGLAWTVPGCIDWCWPHCRGWASARQTPKFHLSLPTGGLGWSLEVLQGGMPTSMTAQHASRCICAKGRTDLAPWLYTGRLREKGTAFLLRQKQTGLPSFRSIHFTPLNFRLPLRKQAILPKLHLSSVFQCSQ